MAVGCSWSVRRRPRRPSNRRYVTRTGIVGGGAIAARNLTRVGRGVLKGSSPWLLVADLGQAMAESAAANSGMVPEAARQLGQAVGLGGSVLIGGILGGPAGAAGGMLSWLVGEAVGQLADWVGS